MSHRFYLLDFASWKGTIILGYDRSHSSSLVALTIWLKCQNLSESPLLCFLALWLLKYRACPTVLGFVGKYDFQIFSLIHLMATERQNSRYWWSLSITLLYTPNFIAPNCAPLLFGNLSREMNFKNKFKGHMGGSVAKASKSWFQLSSWTYGL